MLELSSISSLVTKNRFRAVCLHSFISLTAASVLPRINPPSSSPISSPLQHVARYQWADHHLATISRGPSRIPSAPSVRLKHKILPSSCFQLTTSHESRLAPFCLCFFHRAAIALSSPPRHAVLRVLFLRPHIGILTPFLDALLGSSAIGCMQLINRGIVVCFFSLFCSRARKCNLSSCR
jgi:hypothetical protein